MINIYHPCESIPALCGIHFIPKIEKGRLVLMGPPVKDLPSSQNEPKIGTKTLRLVERSGKNRKISDFMEFTINESDDGEEQLVVERSLQQDH
ncbi:MAG TPA: hypothetical protein VFJ23_03955 [Candidatus Nitrosotalea sp.]|nr:hypothetical protein [Candidatus Nitrosotalea sp.]